MELRPTCPWPTTTRSMPLDHKPVLNKGRSRRSRPTSILDLPAEILHRILLETRHLDGHGFPCLAVCRTWHVLGRDLVWEYLTVKQPQLISLVNRLYLLSNRLTFVKSLSITLPGCFGTRVAPVIFREPGKQGCASEIYEGVNYQSQRLEFLTDAMHGIEKVLNTGLPQLTSFSLRINNEPEKGPWCACRCDQRIEGVHFSRILDALPPTCSSLDLDSGGLDDQFVTRPWGRDYDIRGDHICNSIRRLIGQLRHLRLRLSSLCPDFFLSKTRRRLNARRQYMRASPCRTWADHINMSEAVYSQSMGSLSPIGDHAGYRYNNPMFDIWERWMQMSSNERRHWTSIHEDYNSSPLPADTIQQPLQLRSCIINTCLFPFSAGMCCHGLRGEASAATIAQRLRQAKDIWQIFPNLEQCRVISSDFEASDTELNQYYLPQSKFNPCHLMTLANQEAFHRVRLNVSLGFYEISELISHDIIENITTTVPFKRTNTREPLQTIDLTKLRHQHVYEYKPPHHQNESYLTSFASIEDHIENTSFHTDPNPQQSSYHPPWSHHSPIRPLRPLPFSHYPHDHPETFPGLLDRASIWEERVLHGDNDRYKTWMEVREMFPLATRFGQLKKWRGPEVLYGEQEGELAAGERVEERRECGGREEEEEDDDLFGPDVSDWD